MKLEMMLLIWVGSDGTEKNPGEGWIWNPVRAQRGLWNIILKNYLCRLAELEKAKSQIFQLQ